MVDYQENRKKRWLRSYYVYLFLAQGGVLPVEH